MKYLFLFAWALCMVACQSDVPSQKDESEPPISNPAAAGFDRQGSDPQAIAIADEVMKAMGGRKNWDETPILQWTFLGGSRQLTWDKHNARVRVEFPEGKFTAVYNIEAQTGKVQRNGVEESHPDSLKKFLALTQSIWINDSYWLVMPFKLKDSGVSLTYAGEDSTQAGEQSDVLQLTFKGVGDTPDNKYHVWVSKSERLVKQWAFFREAGQDSANWIRPWTNYQEYASGIKLADKRGDVSLSGVKVYSHLPEQVFQSLEPIDWENLP